MGLSIIAIGNPGSGKSTTLNYLAQKLMFKSGVAIGSGLTNQLNKVEVSGITYCDTPGLNDARKREATGKAISKALKEGGETKIIFFIGQESGRPKQDDVTTMNLVLKAAPEIGNKYGVILPKINKKMAKKLVNRSETSDPWVEFLNGLFAGLEANECPVANVQGVQIHDDLVEEDDALAPKGELKTLENHPLENFVFNLLPSINLTPGKANDVDTTSFEKRQEEIARLMENARSNEVKIKSLQKEVKKAREEQGPIQMILGGLGKCVDNVGGAMGLLK